MDSGVVIRISAGGRAERARSPAGGGPGGGGRGGSWGAEAGGGGRGGAGGLRDADQRGAEVAFDIDGEGLDGGNVEDVAALVARRNGHEHEAIDAPQKGGEGLAGAGGGQDKGRFAAGDGGPAELLGPRGSGEDGVEPRAYGRVEEAEGGFRGHGGRAPMKGVAPAWRS